MSRADRVKVDIWLTEEDGVLIAELVEGPYAGTDLDTGLNEDTLGEQVPLRFRGRLAEGEVVTWLARSTLVDHWLQQNGLTKAED